MHILTEIKEYYAATNNDEITQFTTTWMKLIDIMLSEVNQKAMTNTGYSQ